MNDTKMPPRVAMAGFVLLAFILGLTMCGCTAPGMTVHTTGIPSGAKKVVVSNGIPDTRMDVYVNGDLKCKNLKATDEPFTITNWNFSGSISGVNVLVKAYDVGSGRYVGQASQTFYTSPYDTVPQDWLISGWDLR